MRYIRFYYPQHAACTGLGRASQRLAAAGPTADGRPDLLVISAVDVVRVLPNLGNGAFGAPTSFAGAPTPLTLYNPPIFGPACFE